jgi:hypothetical protein
MNCDIYMEHAHTLVEEWTGMAKTADAAVGATLRNAALHLRDALYHDQHVLFHDAEFVDGCEICDWERKEYE